MTAICVPFCAGEPMFVRTVMTSPLVKPMPYLLVVRTVISWVAQSVVLTRWFLNYGKLSMRWVTWLTSELTLFNVAVRL